MLCCRIARYFYIVNVLFLSLVSYYLRNIILCITTVIICCVEEILFSGMFVFDYIWQYYTVDSEKCRCFVSGREQKALKGDRIAN
jgi:hypothetical protein